MVMVRVMVRVWLGLGSGLGLELGLELELGLGLGLGLTCVEAWSTARVGLDRPPVACVLAFRGEGAGCSVASSSLRA